MEEMKIVYKDIDTLKPAEYNPKKCTPKEEKGIEDSIKKFGFVDPLIVNMHEGRENVIVGGHQRLRVAKKLGYTKLPCVEVYCSYPDEEMELNARLSKNTASIDSDLLAKYFKKDMLLDIGFKEDELKAFQTEFEEKFHKENNSTCVYPLVPKFSEKYDAVIIVSKNSIDTAFLETVLGIEKCQSYKNSRTGKAMVIDVDKFRKQWEEK